MARLSHLKKKKTLSIVNNCIKNLYFKNEKLNYQFKWIKYFFIKIIFHCMSQFMVFKIFQNCLPLYQWHHITFYVKKNHSTKHFNKYNESIIIWYGLWCYIFGTSKVQYVMVSQNLFMKFIHYDQFTSFSLLSHIGHIIHLYFVPWPMIDNPTSCHKIMYSTLMCFHPGDNW